jgi:hypothetical protein
MNSILLTKGGGGAYEKKQFEEWVSIAKNKN